VRLDLYLTQKGYAESRSRAAFLIETGAVTVNGKTCIRAAHKITENCLVAITAQPLPYVSRGGLKLAGAIKDFGLAKTISGAVVLDIGTSTGGFADCLIQHGAEKIYGVDTGRDQLHHSLISHPRLISLEGRNARDLAPADIPEKCSVCTIDVSFTSQTLLYPSILPFLAEGATVISLIKPQFEVGRKGLTKSGKIRTPSLLKQVLEDVTASAAAHGLELMQTAPSRQTGGEGTEEWFGLFRVTPQNTHNACHNCP